MSQNIEYDYLFKILLIGSYTSDKSKILSKILDNNCDEDKFVNKFVPTIGVDFVRLTK